ncbi:hypothetical protein IFR04_007794 [Cadophora malorum]|uniref:Uncharacterized protein n=1 Tax=Cadophora malorum TaxID=108018 RepID=A0A8H7TH41_9HELO|nr:hypothetical protein IFR04_007794 [Cadophora malorum]
MTLFVSTFAEDPAEEFKFSKGKGVPAALPKPKAMREARTLQEVEAEAMLIAKLRKNESGEGRSSAGVYGEDIPQCRIFKQYAANSKTNSVMVRLIPRAQKQQLLTFLSNRRRA